MSVHVFPFPTYPELHLQVKLPILLVQVAAASHGLTVALHSSISRIRNVLEIQHDCLLLTSV